MSTDDASLLASARQALANRLAGDGFESYSTGMRSFKGATILELRALIKELEQKVNLTPSTLIQHIDV